MTKDQVVFDRQYQIFAGKFRRYNGESWLKRLFDFKTNLLNLRDLFYFLFGTVEAWFLLHKVKPDVILLKGGFVGVPVGLAARNRIPMVTHDSDALPGLANRLVSRWVVYHATGMPAEYYSYPPSKTKYVGVIVGSMYKHVTPTLQKEYRHDLKIPADAQVLMITGGSLGAQAINEALVAIAPALLEAHPKLHIIHQTGNGKEDVYGDYRHDRLVVKGLLPLADLCKNSGAADVIVTRAGANTMAEFGVQGKACIVVPNALLTGGHQLKNADALVEQGAAVVLDDNLLSEHLLPTIEDLLKDSHKRHQLAQHLHELTPDNAADKLAELLLQVGGRAGD